MNDSTPAAYEGWAPEDCTDTPFTRDQAATALLVLGYHPYAVGQALSKLLADERAELSGHVITRDEDGGYVITATGDDEPGPDAADSAGPDHWPDHPELTPAQQIIAYAPQELDDVLHQIATVDRWLDGDVAPEYQAQPLAQDWARVAKVAEETGEAVAELILATGQNPRKGRDPAARDRLIAELADTAVTAMFAIQHFTRDEAATWHALTAALGKAYDRAPGEYR